MKRLLSQRGEFDLSQFWFIVNVPIISLSLINHLYFRYVESNLFKAFECTRSMRCCTTLKKFTIAGMAVAIFGGKKEPTFWRQKYI